MNGHIPVLVQEVVEYFRCRSGRTYVDCTLGAGGHAEAILRASGPDGRVIGVDRDEVALSVARERLSSFGARAVFFHEDFHRMEGLMQDEKIGPVDGFLFDLGISSLQLNDPERGFSFQSDGPLDMRMDRRVGRTAADLVNRLPEKELAAILFNYGEERRSRRIAREIVRERKIHPIQTTKRLSSIVVRATPFSGRSRSIHSSTRTFQALRIAVNDELEGLSETLHTAGNHLAPGGRMCVISFHSLEDRITKQTFRAISKEPGSAFRIVTPKPVSPQKEEVNRNPRARSAKLRVLERESE